MGYNFPTFVPKYGSPRCRTLTNQQFARTHMVLPQVHSGCAFVLLRFSLRLRKGARSSATACNSVESPTS